MADVNVGQVAATVFENSLGKKPEDNIFQAHTGLKILKDSGGFKKITGGSEIEEKIEYAVNASFKSYADGETLDTAKYDVFDAARYALKTLAGTVTVYKQEVARAQGEEAKIELVSSLVENGKKSMFETWNAQFYGDGTGNGSKNLGGLAYLVPSDPTTGIVGEINAATWAFWRSKQTLGTKTTTAYDNLRGAMRTVYNQCSNGAYEQHPEFFIFNETDFGGYEGTLTENERFTSKDKGDGGFPNDVLVFKGSTKVTFDVPVAQGIAYCLNARNLKFKYLQWAKVEPAITPANQLADVVQCWSYGNFTSNNRRRLGIITVIT